MKDIFTDIYYQSGDNAVFCFRSGKTVYEEQFSGGRLTSAGWNGAGYTQNVLDNCPTRLNPDVFCEPQAFTLDSDGYSLGLGWIFEDFCSDKIKNANGADITRGILTLKSSVRPLRVRVFTLLDGTPVITRYLELENLSETEKTAISNLSPMSGGLESISGWRDYTHGRESDSLYSLGYMQADVWGREGAFRRRPLPEAGYDVYGRYNAGRFRHPMFTLENKALGTTFIAQLAWSAGYAFSFNLTAADADANLSFKVKIDGPAPHVVLAPGEKYTTPAVHIGMLFGDLDDAVNEMHCHLRRSVFTLPEARGVYGWVEAGMGAERLMDIRATKHFADTAAMVGAETLIIDAGWSCPPGTEGGEWWIRSGDWYPDEKRYPNGIGEIRDYIHEKGLLFGLWLDLERIGTASKVFTEHNDWLLRDRLGNPTTLIDMANPAAAAWVENELTRVITEYKADIFRLDYNIGGGEVFTFITRNGERECAAAKYYDAVYALYRRMRLRFPDVVFENCAGGGGRTDIGQLANFSHTWVSDWQVAPRSAVITNGMTMALPPERVDRLVSGMNSHTRASLDFMVRQTLFGRPTTNDYNAVGSAFNPEQIEFVRHSFDIYKNIIRPFAPDGKIYHHTPEKYGIAPSGDVILERSANDGSAGVIGIFRLSGEPDTDSVTVYPRGVDISKKYKVTFDNRNQSTLVSGCDMVNDGIRVRLAAPMTSELIIYTEE